MNKDNYKIWDSREKIRYYLIYGSISFLILVVINMYIFNNLPENPAMLSDNMVIFIVALSYIIIVNLILNVINCARYIEKYKGSVWGRLLLALFSIILFIAIKG